MIDFSKPVQTRRGLKVRILTTEVRNSDYPVVGLVLFETSDEETVETWTLEGEYIRGVSGSGLDLVNVPEVAS